MPPTDPGPRKVRRLTRHEYNNVLRDLLGVNARPGDNFPADGSGGEGFENNADTLFIPPILIEKYMGGAEVCADEVFSRPELKSRFYGSLRSSPEPERQAVGEAIKAFVQRAYRRPATEPDIQELLGIYDAARGRKADFDAAMKVVLKAVLMSPKFLLIDEQPAIKGHGPQKVNDFDLASRLSFLLWSSLPDDTLFQLAASHRLNDDGVLAEQVKRMLADKRAEAFTLNFGGAWFHFEDLFNVVDPDRRKFPQYNDALRQAMFDEAMAFTDHIFRQNGSVLDFLDSNYSYLNEPLAKLYDVPGVQGPAMRRVTFPNDRRGGLLGMAVVLTTTSYPQRTSPVLRGKWVLEQILGTPPPPPPPNVPQLPEDDRKLKNQTVRQRFEQHRKREVCAGCHKRLDPPGFGLETFNAIGQWRDQENGLPVDASGEMADGRKFNGPAQFRKVLVQDKARFVRTLCTRLLGYAVTRGLEVYDQPTLLRLEETLRKGDYHFEPLAIALVQSYPFRYRRE